MQISTDFQVVLLFLVANDPFSAFCVGLDAFFVIPGSAPGIGQCKMRWGLGMGKCLDGADLLFSVTR